MWCIRGFCLQGYDHLKNGSPCQDAYRHEKIAEPSRGGTVHVLAAADGAGSRPRSAEGAALAVTLTTRVLAARASERGLPGGGPDCHEFLRQAYAQIRDEFFRLTSLWVGKENVEAFAVTLVAAVLTDDLLGIVQIGDGFTIVRAGLDGHGKAQYHLLPRPRSAGEYANETEFITSATAECPQTTCVADPDITGVLISTDGLLQPALTWRAGNPVGANSTFAAAVLGHLDKPQHDPRVVLRTMLSEEVVRRTGDDLTLVAAVRR
jgi:hypothetical protein